MKLPNPMSRTGIGTAVPAARIAVDSAITALPTVIGRLSEALVCSAGRKSRHAEIIPRPTPAVTKPRMAARAICDWARCRYAIARAIVIAELGTTSPIVDAIAPGQPANRYPVTMQRATRLIPGTSWTRPNVSLHSLGVNHCLPSTKALYAITWTAWPPPNDFSPMAPQTLNKSIQVGLADATMRGHCNNWAAQGWYMRRRIGPASRMDMLLRASDDELVRAL
jgi:hypothetical protein